MDIDELEGRELDRRIAEHLGYQDMQTSPDPDTLLYTCKVNASTGERYTLYPDVPHWHRDIAAAWGLVEDMVEGLTGVQLENYGAWRCVLTDCVWGEVIAEATAAPTAIARAYLKAKESQ